LKAELAELDNLYDALKDEAVEVKDKNEDLEEKNQELNRRVEVLEQNVEDGEKSFTAYKKRVRNLGDGL
jgi:predicted  nucleic acid-binding Zn-ribbon protein